MSNPSAPSYSRSSWFVAVPLAVLIVLAIAWSAVWFYATNRAEREIDAWIGREATLGRIWSCGERSLGGFPFRFELSCNAPTLETRGGDPFRFTSASAHAVAQVWSPNHIVAEFKGPAQLRDLATGETFAADWKLLQMSGVGNLSGRPERLSIAVEEPRVETPALEPAQGQGQPALPRVAPGTKILSAKYMEFHARRRPTPNSQRDGVDYAAGMRGGETPFLGLIGATGPLDATLQGSISEADDLRPMPVAQRLRAWAQAGGVAKLDRLVLTTPKVVATASGEVALDPQGLLNGRVNLGFAGLEDVVRGLGQAGAIPSDLAPLVGALAMVGSQGQVEGRRGVNFAISLNKGALRLGPVPMGYVPPLF